MPARRCTDPFVFEELEARILFSADSAALAALLAPGEAADGAVSSYRALVLPALPPAPVSASGSDTAVGQAGAGAAQDVGAVRREIVFIDGAVDDAQSLAAQLRAQDEADAGRTLEVHLIETATGGVEQIGAILAGRQNIDAIHIISHGADGQLQLGATRLDGASLVGNAMAISAWGEALSNDGDILLYGCDVAQTPAGQRFVDAIGQLTGADMQASNDLTGSSLLRGDWTLEYSSGYIDTRVAPSGMTQFSYSGVLGDIVVTSAADSGAGTLRQAIIDANSTPEADTITFVIGTGLKTINLASALPVINTAMTIDASSQPGTSGVPLIEISGAGAPGSTGFRFEAGASGALKGLILNGFADAISLKDVSNISILGNYIGLNADGSAVSSNSLSGIELVNATNNVIGGNTAGSRNVISGNNHHGIDVGAGSTGNVIDGNYIGTNAAGTAAVGNGWSGINVRANGNIIGLNAGNVISGNLQSGLYLDGVSDTTVQKNRIGTNAAGTNTVANTDQGIRIDGATANNLIGGRMGIEGNIISGNLEEGITIASSSGGNTISGNYLGVSASGTTALPNRRTNLYIQGSNNVIGSGTAEYGNVISGSREAGIVISGGASNTVQGNYIGTGANGAGDIMNLLSGVRLENGANNNLIGGTSPGQGNVIANNGESGIVAVDTGTTNNRFYANSIYNNGDLGIDLAEDGVTANDAGDADSGPNGRQNFPEISAVTRSGSSLTVEFTLTAVASDSYRIEFFASTSVDGSGYGEGQRFLDAITITLDGSGAGSYIRVIGNASTKYGDYITATATRVSAGHTSEFSMAVRIPGVNSAPAGANAVVNLQEDTTVVLRASDFQYTDGNSPADTFHSVGITTLPGSGSLRLNGLAVTAGTFILKSDIDLNRLTYTPVANVNGSVGGMTFQVRDNGGTANGGADTDPVARQMRFSIASVNDAPVGANGRVSTPEDTDYVFKVSEFPFSDPNDAAQPNNLYRVLIDSLPANGTLLYRGNAFAAGNYVNVDDIQAGFLVFRPSDNVNGANLASFNFRVQDDGASGNDTDPVQRTMTIDVTPVNDPPQGASKTVTFLEDHPYVFSLDDFGYSDPDDAPPDAFLAIRIDAAPAGGTLRIDGTVVTANMVVTRAAIEGGRLVFTPDANYNGYTGMDFRVVDDGGTNNGGSNTDATVRTVTMHVLAVNDAPAGVSIAKTISEGGSYTFHPADFGFADVDNDAFNRLVVTTLPSSGRLTDNGAPVSTGAGGAPQYIDIDAGHVVFTPDADFNGTVSFTFQLMDNGGTGNGGADTDATPRTFTFHVTPVADAPQGTDKTVTLAEDGAHIFTAADFGFDDARDAMYGTGNALRSVVITTLADGASLTNDGVAVFAGQEISVADIDSGLLVLTPAANANGRFSFTFQVRDDGDATLGGADLDTVARTMAFDVTPVDDAPAGSTGTVSTQSGVPYVFRQADFGFSDASDDPANDFHSVIITTIPAGGTLTNNGVALGAGAVVLAADIDAGRLAYSNGAHTLALRAERFTFQVVDNGGSTGGNENTDPTARTMNVLVAAQNAPPRGADTTVTLLEDGRHVFAVADFGFADPDNTPQNGFASVVITTVPLAGTLSRDGLALGDGSTVTRAEIEAGLLVYTPLADANGAEAASFTFQVQDDGGSANGGRNTDPTPKTMTIAVTAVNDAPAGAGKTVTLDEDTDYRITENDFQFSDAVDGGAHGLFSVFITGVPARGTLTLDGVAVAAGSEISRNQIASGVLLYRPPAGAHGAALDNLGFQVRDSGGTDNGGVDRDPVTRAIVFDVRSVNDAPAGADRTVVTLEDTPYVFRAGDFFFSDADDMPANGLLSIRIDTLLASGRLTLYGADIAAGAFVLSSDIAAGALVYTPDTDVNGAARFTFHVRDDGGRDNGGRDIDPVARTMTIAVTPVNDAPVGRDHTVTTGEDRAYTFAPSDFGFSDPRDGTAHAPFSVVFETLPASGQLLFRGAAFLAGNYVTMEDIANGDLVYRPAANAHDAAGANGVGFTFRVRDNGGTANGGSDTDAVGRAMTIRVESVNDAPMGAAGAVTTREDTPYVFAAGDFGFLDPSDNPANNFLSVVIDVVPLRGSLSLGGVAVGAGSVIQKSAIDAGQLVYRPDADAHGDGLAGFMFRVRDDGGSARGGADTDTVARRMSISVTSVNDAPAGADNTIGLLEDGRHVFSAADFGFTDRNDATGGDLFAVVIANAPSNGVLRNDGVVLGAGAVVLRADIDAGRLVYLPAADVHGADGFRFQVRDVGGTVNGGIDTDPTARLMTLVVAPVNDAPEGTATTITTEEGKAHVFTVAEFGFSDRRDGPADDFLSVTFSRLPASGVLTSNGVVVAQGGTVQRGDIAAGRLVYTPANNAGVGQPLFLDFQVRDSGGVANGGSDTDPSARTMVIMLSRSTTVIPDRNIGNILPGNGQGGNPDANANAGSGAIAGPGANAGPAVGQSSPSEQAEAVQAAESKANAGAAAAPTNGAAPPPASTGPGTGAGPRTGMQAASAAVGGVKSSMQLAIEQNVVVGNETRFTWERTDIVVAAETTKKFEPVLAYKDDAKAEKPSSASLLLQIEVERRAAATPPKMIFSGGPNAGIVASSAPADEAEDRANDMRTGGAVRMETAAALGALGTVWVVARKAALVASLLTTVPAWLRLDPLPILSGEPEPEDEEKTGKPEQLDSVEHMFSVEGKQAKKLES